MRRVMLYVAIPDGRYEQVEALLLPIYSVTLPKERANDVDLSTIF